MHTYIHVYIYIYIYMNRLRRIRDGDLDDSCIVIGVVVLFQIMY